MCWRGFFLVLCSSLEKVTWSVMTVTETTFKGYQGNV